MTTTRQRKQNLLTARTIETAKEPGRYSDGNGLYLVVRPGGSKQWVFLYRRDGKLKEMGLGSPLKGVTLAKARELRDEARAAMADGGDPLEAAGKPSKRRPGIPTFGAYALALVERIEDGFSNPKHRQQWKNTLETYCEPIWETRIDRVDTAGVLECLTPIWQAKPETASRVRGRIERVLNAAKAERLRAGENPAAWRGHLDATLPKPAKLTRGHHAALAYADMPAFMADLRARPALAALALELAILTATRTSEVLNAKWTEFDLDAGLWTIPAERMKARREHRVALSKRALAIVNELDKARTSEFVFPGQKPGKPAVQHGDADAVGAHGPARCDNLARVPLDVFRLGVGSQPVFVGASRNRAGAHDRQQGRSRLSARRCAGKAPGDDGGLGAMVRAEGGECAGLRQAGRGWLSALPLSSFPLFADFEA